jgi:hypothetical protein
LYVANLHGLKLKEIPVRWNHDERTKVSVIRDSHRMFNEVRLIRKYAKNGEYDLSDGEKLELSQSESSLLAEIDR